jgi:hypothetical protein
MASYRIVCTKKRGLSNPAGHTHITEVGTGTAGNFSKSWTTQDVFNAMAKGDTFFTQGKKSGKTAQVQKLQCLRCTEDTLQSAADAVDDNKLENLPTCE